MTIHNRQWNIVKENLKAMAGVVVIMGLIMLTLAVVTVVTRPTWHHHTSDCRGGYLDEC